MARRLKTIKYAFDTLVTAGVAITSALGTSTRHDFVGQDGAALTIYIPETNGRIFRSVIAETTWRHGAAATANIRDYRLGIKLGAVAFNDRDYDQAASAHTSDHECSTFMRDVTEYFNTNFGSGASQTCQVGWVVAGATTTVQNFTCVLYITYEYDDSYAPTLIKTVQFLIQSYAGGGFVSSFPTTAFNEIGNDGTCGRSAQIPALDTVLPETGKVYRNTFIEFLGNDEGLSTVDFSASVLFKRDVLTISGSNRCILDQTSTTATWYKDVMPYRTTDVSPTASHSLFVASSLRERFSSLGAILNVTYEFTGSSTKTMNSVMLFPTNKSDILIPLYSTSPDVTTFKFFVPEPSPSAGTFGSGIVLYHNKSDLASGSLLLVAPELEEVTRTYGYSGSAESGGSVIINRFDDNGATEFGWKLTPGMNYLHLTMSQTRQLDINISYLYAIVNYTSSIASSGIGTHNRTVCHAIAEQVGTGVTDAALEYTRFIQQSASLPATGNLDDRWYLNNLGFEVAQRTSDKYAGVSLSVINNNRPMLLDNILNYSSNNAEMCTRFFGLEATSFYNRNSAESGGLNPNSSYTYNVRFAGPGFSTIKRWTTFNSVTFTLTGSVVGYTGSPAGIPVEIWNNETDKLECLTYTNAHGAYTGSVFNTGSYFAVALQSGSYRGRSGNKYPV